MPLSEATRWGRPLLRDGGERFSRLRSSGRVADYGAANRGTLFSGYHLHSAVGRYMNCQMRARLMLNTKLLRCVGPTRASVVLIAPSTHMGARKSTTPRSPDPTRDLREHGAARGYNRRANSGSMRWAAEALGFGTSTERGRNRESRGSPRRREHRNEGRPPLPADR